MKVYIDNYPELGDEGRKVDVTIDDYDLWSLDCTLAYVILPALKQFKEQNDAIPGGLVETAYTTGQMELDLGMTEEQVSELRWLEGERQWNEILDKMIWSFERILDQFSPEEDYTTRRTKEYQDKLDEGLALFGKYYRCLWI